MPEGPVTVNSFVFPPLLAQTYRMNAGRIFSRFLRLSVVIGVLGGCVPLTIFHREGASVARMQQDEASCEVQALNEAPVKIEIEREPPIFLPPQERCDSQGNCVTTPGRWIPGEVYRFDANEAQRRRVETQCMAQLGYSRVSIPRCSGDVARSVPVAATSRLPPLNDASCSVRNRDGTWQIVNVE